MQFRHAIKAYNAECHHHTPVSSRMVRPPPPIRKCTQLVKSAERFKSLLATALNINMPFLNSLALAFYCF